MTTTLSLEDQIEKLTRELETARQEITFLRLKQEIVAPYGSFASPQDKENNDRRCKQYGGPSLQYRWRHPDTVPDYFNVMEAEAAILDAFISQGGAHVWSGDGSSCAAQIVQAVWQKKQREIDELKEELEDIFGPAGSNII